MKFALSGHIQRANSMHLRLPANAASKHVPAPPRKTNMTTSHGDPKRIFIAGPCRENPQGYFTKVVENRAASLSIEKAWLRSQVSQDSL